jgi:hypothetical protein
MSDSRRWSSADSENMREKKLQKFIRGRAQRQKCSETLAPIHSSFSPVALSEIGKFTSLG